jgi:hypothetical protein
MIAVEYSEPDFCIDSDYGCRDAARPLNKLHETEETYFAITDIEPPSCIKVMDMIFDENLDSSIRSRIKATHIEGKFYPIPSAVRDIVEGKKPKILTPLERGMWGVRVKVGPGVVIPNDGKKPRIEDFIRHIRKH